MIDIDKLINKAEHAKKNSYAPYSNFKVGAAVLTSSDKIYTGCNIENASLGATNCAERTAIYKAVSEGEKQIKAIAIITDSKNFVFPCGICRQVMMEFSTQDTLVIVVGENNIRRIYKLSDLLPFSFSKNDLE